MLILILLHCVEAVAVERIFYQQKNDPALLCEEFKASWEGKADAELMGEAVLRDLRKSGNSYLKLNSLCSLESIMEFDILRERLLSIIESGSSAVSATEEIKLAALILVKTASADITGLSINEDFLIKRVNSLPVQYKDFKKEGLSKGVLPYGEFSLLIPESTVSSSGSGFYPQQGVLRKNVRALCPSKIAPGRDFETAHADYYRLFLYMRDAAGDSFSAEHTYSFPPSNTQLLSSFISSAHNREQQASSEHRNENIIFSSLTDSFFKHPLFPGNPVRRGRYVSFFFCGGSYSSSFHHFYHNHHGGLS